MVVEMRRSIGIEGGKRRRKKRQMGTAGKGKRTRTERRDREQCKRRRGEEKEIGWDNMT